MKHFKGKNLLAFVLALAVLLSGIPVTAKQSQEDKQDVLQYMLVESPQLTTPATQNIVVGIGQEGQSLSEAKLHYRNNTTGVVYQKDATKMVDGAALFSVAFTDEKQSGEYEILSLECVVDGISYRFSMDSLNMDTRFGVNCSVDTKPDGYVMQDEMSASNRLVGAAGSSSADAQIAQEVVTFDAKGNATSENTLSEAILNAKKNNVGAKKKNLVVVLDPGHGGYDGGAQGNGLSEKNLNLSIASYCKQELETYSGVTVYMTRSDDTFVSLEDRTTLAKNWGADVFVSIHINSAAETAHGSEVWYPNPSGNAQIHTQGAQLAQKILDQLGALGLYKRGIHYRNYSYDWSVDENIGDADYYAVIRGSKAKGFPGVIVEHAFISNPSDAATYLGNEAALKNLGAADAKGIASAYGLTKEPTYTKADTKVTTAFDTAQTKVTLKATGMKDANAVKFCVYSTENGKDDLKWYTAKQKGGVWTASVKLSNHKTAGKYIAQLYVVPQQGAKYKVTQTSFRVSGPTVQNVGVSKVNKEKGTFTLQTNAQAKPGIESVRVAVFRKSNQSDLKWYNQKLQKDGSYKVTVHNKSFKDAYGTYYYQVQVKDKNGVVTTSDVMSYRLSKPKVSWTLKDKSSYTKKQVTLKNLPYAENTKQIKLVVISEEKGEGFSKSYTAKKNAAGDYTADIKIKDFKKGGKYEVTAYSVLKTGKQKKLGTKTFTVTTATAKSVQVTSANPVKGTFKVTETISSKAPVSKVEMQVWCEGKKVDKATYVAGKNLNGTYSATVNIKNHKYHYGKFWIYTYVTDKNGIKTCVDKRNYTLKKPSPTASLTANENKSRETVVVKNVPYGSRVKSVRYKVWSEANGKDDVKTYVADKQKTGQYSYVIPLTNHMDTGKIRVEVWAYYKDGGKEKLLTKKFSINLYAIAGETGTDAGQLVRYYNANAVYPSYYSGSDAPNIETFAQIYIEECNAEGIRAEVAFAQAMKETGFLRYGGRVPITALNFAGLGAVDNDVTAYATFGSVREGIRAQIQHLKAYANGNALNQPCVDGRFHLVTRGTAPYVEWLGINENPYGKGWASALRYGYSLRDDYIAKLLRY